MLVFLDFYVIELIGYKIEQRIYIIKLKRLSTQLQFDTTF